MGAEMHFRCGFRGFLMGAQTNQPTVDVRPIPAAQVTDADAWWVDVELAMMSRHHVKLPTAVRQPYRTIFASPDNASARLFKCVLRSIQGPALDRECDFRRHGTPSFHLDYSSSITSDVQLHLLFAPPIHGLDQIGRAHV